MAKIEEKIIDDINIDNNFASKQLNSDIIPYACYYDENTIITQNGELLSTIKIPSFIVNKSLYFTNVLFILSYSSLNFIFTLFRGSR